MKRRQFITLFGGAAAWPVAVEAQEVQSPPDGRVTVIGEGSVSLTPDYAQIESGVTSRGRTVKEASDANSKLIGAITSALLESGIEQKDVQTSRFSVQPVYAPQEPRTEPKLVGYSVSNHVRVKIRQIDKVGEILDRLITAGVTDVGNISFLVSDPSKALDQARKAAITDARRKTEVYAEASGLRLGRVIWITEDSGFAPSVPMQARGASAALAAPVPIAPGEDTFRVKVTVGFVTRDIVPVASINNDAFVMLVNPSFPAKTVPEFLAYAKVNPGPKDMMISQLINQQIEELLAWGFVSALAVVLLIATSIVLAVYNRFFGLDRLWG